MNGEPYQWTPELFQLVADTIPVLCRSKRDVILFFKGAGVHEKALRILRTQVETDRHSISKAEIAKSILTRLNQEGDYGLRARREVLKRVMEFENFTTCWPNDQHKAQSLVRQVRDVVGRKDSFTRMKIERDKEVQKRRRIEAERLRAQQAKKCELEVIRKDLSALFSLTNPHERGRRLESLLNQLFEASDILVRKAFQRVGDKGKGTVEQIDGVVELNNDIYLVEVKWETRPLGKGPVSEHLVRVYSRGDARGILISTSEFTQPAVEVCKEALTKSTIVLCLLEEIVLALERGVSIELVLVEKIEAAIIDKEPLHRVSAWAAST